MDDRVVRLGALGAAAAGGIVALLALPGSAVAEAAAVVAVLSAGALLVVEIGRRAARPERRPVPPLAPPSVRFAGAYRPGSLARERTVFLVQGLEFGGGRRTGSSWSPEELRAILEAPPERFAAWLDARLGKLEQEG